MALKAQLDTLDGLPEAVAKEYKKVEDDKGTRFILDTEGVEDVTGLKSALVKERSTRTELEKVAKRLGIPVGKKEDLDKLLEKINERTVDELLTAAEGKAVQESEAVEAEKRKAKRQLDALNEELSSLRNVLQRTAKKDAAIIALKAAGGNEVLMLPHVIGSLKAVEEDGEDGKTYTVQVVDAKGEPRLDAKGNPLTVAALVDELKARDEYKGAFAGSGASGSGAPGGTRSSAPSGSAGGARTAPARRPAAAVVSYGI